MTDRDLTHANLDAIRANALGRVERGRRHVTLAIALAAIVEGAGLIAFVLLANFSDRTHLLLLIASLLIYGTLAFGIIALGAYVNYCTWRVLKAVAASGEEPAQPGP